jgi:hypothetical protein
MNTGSRDILEESVNPPLCMKPTGSSLPCSQEPPTGPCHEPDSIYLRCMVILPSHLISGTVHSNFVDEMLHACPISLNSVRVNMILFILLYFSILLLCIELT